MNDKLKNSLASLKMEGFDFTDEQIAHLTDLARRADDGKITWDEAIAQIIEKHGGAK